MANLSQLQMRYDEEEDRLLLRINTSADEEFRFWLTRRFIITLWPLLQAGLMSSPDIKQRSTQQNKAAVLNFEHEKAQKDVDYSATFKTEPQTLPLGEEPLLLNRASLKPLDNTLGIHTLHLQATDDRGVEFVLDQRLMHILTRVVIDSLKNTQWGLKLGIAPTINSEQAIPSTRKLH